MEFRVITTKKKVKIKPPRFRYLIDSKRLPEEVHGVMKDIQNLMMDDVMDRDRNKRKTIPDMPRDFFCSEATIEEKEKMVKIAGKGHESCLCNYLIIPFLMRPLRTTNPRTRWFDWSGNVTSLHEVRGDDSQLAVVNITGSLIRVKDPSNGERKLNFFSIPEDLKGITSKPLKRFLESSLVVYHPDGCCLVSSYKMTISWLRSRLDKALNKYKEMEKAVEVIASIKQKEGGPLLLHVQVEKEDSGELIQHKFLFILCPAFRLSPCYLAIPLVSHLADTSTEFADKDEPAKHCLWKIITKCFVRDEYHRHRQPNFADTINVQRLSQIQVKEKPEKPAAYDQAMYKESITNPQRISPAQREQCLKCLNPASRMLLEYYYQYGCIPEEDMNQASSFVTDILGFFEDSIAEDRQDNDPKVIDFVKSGSAPERLKVVKPDEFDVMIRIDLPKSTKCYTFTSHHTFPVGYAICQVKRSHAFSRNLQRCFRKSDEFGHCLAPEQIAFGWLHGKLDRAINKYKDAAPKADLKLRRSGPALLLEIRPFPPHMAKLPRIISVDLVLALKLSESDSRYAVAKRAKEEHFYKKVVIEKQAFGNSPCESKQNLQIQEKEKTVEEKSDHNAKDGKKITEETEFARKNLKYLWRISYSAQEKRYLEYVEEIQRENGVEGCQNICLMILKTICTREVLKREESVLYRELRSYILKTSLFHVLAKSNLIQDWKMDCLADRYVDLLNKLSKWQDLPHFFFNNVLYLKGVFPEDDWCNEIGPSKNLLDEFHASLKLQLFERFSQIVQSFTSFKEVIDGKYFHLVTSMNDWKTQPEHFNYETFMQGVLNGKSPEEVIHPPFTRAHSHDHKARKSLVDQQAEDTQVRQAAKVERKSGYYSSVDRNLQRS